MFKQLNVDLQMNFTIRSRYLKVTNGKWKSLKIFAYTPL